MHVAIYFFNKKIISPPVVSVSARIGVVSGREGTFRVRCTSFGGRALNMSVTGPGGFSEDLDNIQAVGTPQRMGNDSFSDSTDIISGGSDGQVYECTVSNGVSSNPTGSVKLKGELWTHCAIFLYGHAVTYCDTIITVNLNSQYNIINLVAAPPTNLSAELVSPTTVSVSWQPPSDGSLTDYLLSYTDQTETITHTLHPSITRFTVNTNCKVSMNISLQALSQHIPSIPVTTEFILRELATLTDTHRHYKLF